MGEIVSEEHRQKNIKVILERKKLADARVRQRLMIRRKSKQIKQQQQIKQKVSPEQLVSIEKIRLRLYEKIQTGQRLKAIFNQLDIDHSGMLSKNEFNTLILKVFKKKECDVGWKYVGSYLGSDLGAKEAWYKRRNRFKYVESLVAIVDFSNNRINVYVNMYLYTCNNNYNNNFFIL